MIKVELDNKAKNTVAKTLDLGGQDINDRFTKLKDSENLYYGESLDGCKVVINLKNYYENSTKREQIPTQHDQPHPTFDYPEARVLLYNVMPNDGGTSYSENLAIWLKYDEARNVYCHFSYSDDGNPYQDVTEAIKVLNAGQDLSELPQRVLFEIPEGFSMKVIGGKTMLTSILPSGWSSTSGYLVKAYK